MIMGFTLAGEALQRLLPFPIPASVYGLALLFTALCTGIVKLHQVRDTGMFLTSILPVLFVSPTVGIVEHWSLIRPQLLAIILIMLASTVISFAVSGMITQHLTRKDGEDCG